MNKYNIGEIRNDGLVFWAYTSAFPPKERWVSQDKFVELKNKHNERARKYLQDPLVKARALARSAAFRESNRDSVNKSIREWGAANGVRRSFLNGKAKALRNGSHVELSQDDEKMVMDLYAWKSLLNNVHGFQRFHIDHVIPVSSGGKHHPLNMVVSTKEYNLKKGQGVAPHRNEIVCDEHGVYENQTN